MIADQFQPTRESKILETISFIRLHWAFCSLCRDSKCGIRPLHRMSSKPTQRLANTCWARRTPDHQGALWNGRVEILSQLKKYVNLLDELLGLFNGRFSVLKYWGILTGSSGLREWGMIELMSEEAPAVSVHDSIPCFNYPIPDNPRSSWPLLSAQFCRPAERATLSRQK